METSEPQVEQQISSPLKEVRPKRKSKPKRYMTFTGTESRLDFLINKKMVSFNFFFKFFLKIFGKCE